MLSFFTTACMIKTWQLLQIVPKIYLKYVLTWLSLSSLASPELTRTWRRALVHPISTLVQDPDIKANHNDLITGVTLIGVIKAAWLCHSDFKADWCSLASLPTPIPQWCFIQALTMFTVLLCFSCCKLPRVIYLGEGSYTNWSNNKKGLFWM